MKDDNYLPVITVEKGVKQLVNVVTSTGFSAILLILLQEIFNKEFKITDIQNVLDHIGKGVIVIVPLISSAVSMAMNFKKHYFKK